MFDGDVISIDGVGVTDDDTIDVFDGDDTSIDGVITSGFNGNIPQSLRALIILVEVLDSLNA